MKFFCILFYQIFFYLLLLNCIFADEYKKVTINVIEAQKELEQFFVQMQTTTYKLPQKNKPYFFSDPNSKKKLFNS